VNQITSAIKIVRNVLEGSFHEMLPNMEFPVDLGVRGFWAKDGVVEDIVCEHHTDLIPISILDMMTRSSDLLVSIGNCICRPVPGRPWLRIDPLPPAQVAGGMIGYRYGKGGCDQG
jgi:hypothetical protein